MVFRLIYLLMNFRLCVVTSKRTQPCESLGNVYPPPRCQRSKAIKKGSIIRWKNEQFNASILTFSSPTASSFDEYPIILE